MSQSWVGKSIGGRYKIEALLGQGGMAAVYKATDPNLNRRVAIKLIHTHLSTEPDFIGRFKEEATAIARLRHPNIVQVHDFNVDNGTYYMVMEYLVGETLQARLKRLNAGKQQIPVSDVLRFSMQLGNAVSYAHNHELIHRDVKPANIMLTVDDQAILMDFGIVKIIGGDYHTGSGATIGTAKYMSPEQIRSERVDERSDIYSFGVTLYEMLSGRAPYSADSALTLMMMVLNDPLPDLKEAGKDIPENLVAIVNKALEKDSDARFQTMGEMIAAMKQAQAELDVLPDTKSVTTADEEKTELMTHTTAPRTVAEEEVETEIVDTAQIESLDLEQLRGDSKEAAVAISSPVKSQEAPLDATPMRRIHTRTRSRKRPLQLSLMAAVLIFGFLFMYFRAPPGIQEVPISTPSESINAQNAQLVVSLGRWETSSHIEKLAFSPDGKLLGTTNNRGRAYFSRYRFYNGLWQVEAGSLQAYLPGHTQWVFDVAFSPDGQFFGSASDDGSVIIWHFNDGILFRKIESQAGGFTSLAFSPNNLVLATGSGDGSVNLWQISDGNLLRTMREDDFTINDVAFSPDGTHLAAASENNSILLWQVSDGSLSGVLKGHIASIHEVTFSPDGLLLASASDDQTVKIWQLSSGDVLQNIRVSDEPVYDVAFSPDNSLIASGSGDGKLILWQASNGSLLSTLTEESDSIITVSFSPDGRLLASGSGDGVIQFWGISEALLPDDQ